MHRIYDTQSLERLKHGRQNIYMRVYVCIHTQHTYIYIYIHAPSAESKSGSLARNCGLRIISAVNSLTFGLRAYRVWYYGSFSRPLPGARGRRIPEGLKGAITPSSCRKGEEGGGRRGRLMRRVERTSGSSATLACPGSQRTSRGAVIHGHKGNRGGVASRTTAGNDSVYLECDDIDCLSSREIVIREVLSSIVEKHVTTLLDVGFPRQFYPPSSNLRIFF